MRLPRYLERIVPSGGVVHLVGASAAAQAISLLAAPVSTRLYGPSDYGVLAVFNALLGVPLIVASLRYELSISVPKEDEDALDLLFLCFVLLASTVTGVVCIVLFFGTWILQVARSGALKDLIWMIPIGLLGAGAYQILSYWTVRQRRYKELARTKLSQSILGSLTMIGIGAAHPGPFGLILSGVVSQTWGIMLLQRDPIRAARRRTSPNAVRNLLSLARRYRRFAVLGSGAALANSAATILPPLLLARLYSAEVTGWFSLSYKVMLLPMSLIGSAFGQVFLGDAGRIIREEPEKFEEYFRHVRGQLMVWGILVLVGGAVSPVLFPVVFGAKWSMAGTYAMLISVLCAAQVIVSPVSTIVLLKGRMGLQFLLDLTRALLVFFSLQIPACLGCSGLTAVASYSAVMTGVYALYYLVYRKISARP